MKNSKKSVKKETLREAPEVSEAHPNKSDWMGPEGFGEYDEPDLGRIFPNPKNKAELIDFYEKAFATDLEPVRSPFFDGDGRQPINNNDAWIQTYSGRRFSPVNPDPKSIVLQDIAHSLSMQCRFSGHSKKFYSVAQHSVLVSYICDSADALWGLLHDASEAYCVDIPRPLKQSGLLQGYIDIENAVQQAVCHRFNLSPIEPSSVKIADKQLLATEARDLMTPHHCDWHNLIEPLPFLIEPWGQQQAENLFIKRFFEITKAPNSYFDYYLIHKNNI